MGSNAKIGLLDLVYANRTKVASNSHQFLSNLFSLHKQQQQSRFSAPNKIK